MDGDLGALPTRGERTPTKPTEMAKERSPAPETPRKRLGARAMAQEVQRLIEEGSTEGGDRPARLRRKAPGEEENNGAEEKEVKQPVHAHGGEDGEWEEDEGDEDFEHDEGSEDDDELSPSIEDLGKALN